MEEIQKALSQDEAERAAQLFTAKLAAEPEREMELAQAMGPILAAEYNRLAMRPVLQFVQVARQSASKAVLEELLNHLKPLAERTQHWKTELEAITRERLAREARAAVTLNDLNLAGQRGAALIARGEDEKETAQLAQYFIEAVGGLYRDHERAAKVIAALAQAGVIGSLMGFDWREVFQAARERASKAAMEESNREWTLNVSSTCGAMLEFLPFRREAGEPTPEQVKKFLDEILAVLRAGLSSGYDDDLIDSLNVVFEFCPTDPPLVQSIVGVEPRLFLELGPKAKLAAVRALGQLGQIPELRKRIRALAESAEGEARVEMLAAVMGGLRHDDFFPYLKQAYVRTRIPKQQEALVEAMGRIANPEGIDLLVEELLRAMKKPQEPAEMRRARMVLTSLGRIGRSSHVDSARRKALIRQVIDAVGERELGVAQFAATQMFAARVEELDREMRAWAARQLTRALFTPDRGEFLGDHGNSPLGFRQPIVMALARLGRDMLPEILSLAQPHATKYGPQLLAFAELMQKMGGESAAPLLETMINTTFLHVDDPKTESYLMKEKVRDAATGEMRDLDKDAVAQALLFALEKVGGAKAQGIILEIADRVQAGQLTSPGGETSSFLLNAKRKHGSIGKLSHAEPAPSEEEFPEDEVRRAMGLAKGGLFSNAQKQIVGLSYLGRAKRPESLPSILACLASKEHLVLAAAESALAAFVTPLPDAKRFERILMDLFGETKLLKGDVLERLVMVIERSFPKRPPYDGIFNRYVGTEITDAAAAHRLRGALLVVDPFAGSAPPAEIEGGEEGEAGEAEPAAAAKRAAPHPHQPQITLLDRKREYMQARQAWIKAGKQGPPPDPPE